jgi:hypothetical protein
LGRGSAGVPGWNALYGSLGSLSGAFFIFIFQKGRQKFAALLMVELSCPESEGRDLGWRFHYLDRVRTVTRRDALK